MACRIHKRHKPQAPAMQGWCRMQYARTSHWFTFKGQSLCEQWSREFTDGSPPTERPQTDLSCGACARLLAERLRGGHGCQAIATTLTRQGEQA